MAHLIFLTLIHIGIIAVNVSYMLYDQVRTFNMIAVILSVSVLCYFAYTLWVNRNYMDADI